MAVGILREGAVAVPPLTRGAVTEVVFPEAVPVTLPVRLPVTFPVTFPETFPVNAAVTVPALKFPAVSLFTRVLAVFAFVDAETVLRLS